MTLKAISFGFFLQLLCLYSSFGSTGVHRIVRDDSDSIPPSDPWTSPSSINPAPQCMGTTPAYDCPFSGYDSIDACSTRKCTMSLSGACKQWVLLVDKSCLCSENLNSKSCTGCVGRRSRALYLSWLNSTCGDITSWHGLPSDWTSEILTAKSFVWVGNATGPFGYAFGPEPCSGLPSSYCRTAYFPEWDLPAQTSCSAINSSLWEPFIYNATEAAEATPEDINKTYAALLKKNCNDYYCYNPKTDIGLYLDLEGFCWSAYKNSSGLCDPDIRSRLKFLLWAAEKCTPSQAYGWPENWKDSIAIVNSSFIEASTVPSLLDVSAQNCSEWINSTLARCTSQRCKGSTCDDVVNAVEIACLCSDKNLFDKCSPTALEQTVDFLWFNKTCGPISEFPGYSGAWESSLLIMNSSYSAPEDFTTWPGCVNAKGCWTSLNETLTNCTQTLCDVDSNTQVCNSTSSGLRPECYCSPISFEGTCNENCRLSWEREELLNWMNSTCSPVASWHGLPSNWVDLRLVQDWELLPWNGRIQITAAANAQNSTATQDQPRHCPSTSSKLAAFAAVNAAMALLMPLLGRRDLLKWATLGHLGKRASPMWLATGPLTVLLHIASNAIAALIIKRTPGFEYVDIGQLVLLWCTRPRLAWLIVAFIPFQASNEIYFSVASSTLIAELVLQILGGYYMGIATNYARRQKWYQQRRLTKTAKGRDAMIMYAGSILWLSVIVIAILTCVWSLLGLSRFVAAFAGAIRGLDRRARKRAKLVESRASSFAKQRDQLTEPLADQWVAARLPTLRSEAERNQDAIHQRLNILQEYWKRLEIYATKDMKAMRAAEREARARKRNSSVADKSQPPATHQVAKNVELERSQAFQTWMNAPSDQIAQISGLKNDTETHEKWAAARKFSVDVELAATARDHHRYLTALPNIEEQLRCLDRVSRRFVDWNPGPLGALDPQTAYLHALAGISAREPFRMQLVANWVPSIQERNIILSFLNTEGTFTERRERLIGPNRNVQEDVHSIKGLQALIGESDARLGHLRKLEFFLSTVISMCSMFDRDCVALTEIWTKQRSKREAEHNNRLTGNNALLRKIALRTILGMIGCCAAQWVWWVGYIKVAGDTYCPPKLAKIAVIWTIFSLMGGILGGSF